MSTAGDAQPEGGATAETAVSKIQNYTEYYARTDWARRQVNEERAYSLFVTPTEEGPFKTHAQLYEEMKRTASEMPHGYLVAQRDSEWLQLYHRTLVFPTPLGMEPEEWHDKVMLFNGDVMGTQMPQAFHAPAQLLAQSTATVKVLSWQAYVLHYTENVNALPLVIPEDTPEGQYTTVQTRKAMYVSPSLMGIFLDRKNTIGRAVLAVHHALTDAGADKEHYQPLLDWLRVLSTAGGKETVQRAQPPTGVLLTQDLTARLLQVVQQDLPQWQETSGAAGRPPTQTTQGANVGGTDHVAALIALATEALASRSNTNPRVTPADREKIPSEYWKGTIDQLLGLTQTTNEDDLAPIWKKWANCDKRERRTVLQTTLRNTASSLRMTVPVATVELVNSMVNLEFAASFVDHLEQGLQPFMVSYLDQQTISEQRAIIDTYDVLQEGAPTLTDLLNLKEAAKLPLPTEEKQCRKTVESFAVVLAVSLGVTSPVFKAYRKYIVDDFDQVTEALEEESAKRPTDLPYAQYLRAIQLEMNMYWLEAQKGRETPVPNFQYLHQEIKRRTWAGPAIPAIYRPTTKRTRFEESGTSGKGEQQEEQEEGPPRKYLKNLKVDVDVMDRASSIGKIHPFLRKLGEKKPIVWPKLKCGKVICIAWHVRGGCYSDCSRKAGHVPLGEGDSAMLCKFLDDGLAKVAKDKTEG